MKRFDQKFVRNKRVLLRVDFNVDLDKKGHILNDFRIRATLPTIEKIIFGGAKSAVLISHRGDPKGKKAKELSLKPLLPYLEKKLKKKIIFLPSIDDLAEQKINQARKGEIFLLENIRFWPGEEKNSPALAKKLAKLGDVFIFDGFGVSHRKHASISALAKILPARAGLLVEKEIKNLSRARDNFQSPFCLVLGGKKISDKLPLVKNLADVINFLVLGGGPANTVLKDMGFEAGKSLVEEKIKPKDLRKYFHNEKMNLIMPGDFIVKEKNSLIACLKQFQEIKKEDVIFDIGLFSASQFSAIIKKSKTIVWSGPMGLFEDSRFSQGTEKVAKAIAQSKGFSVAGGGDTIEAIQKFGLLNKFGFVSTGGGAMLKFLAGEKLPGLENLE